MRRKRTPVGLPPPRRRGPGRGFAVAAAIVAASIVCIVAALQIAGDTPSAPPPPPGGLTDRMAFDAAMIGATPRQVRRVLGDAPRAVETSPLQRDAPECWVYARRSGREGGYRLCFRGGALVSKSRIATSG